jgi:hypothetical protein
MLVVVVRKSQPRERATRECRMESSTVGRRPQETKCASDKKSLAMAYLDNAARVFQNGSVVYPAAARFGKNYNTAMGGSIIISWVVVVVVPLHHP